MAIQPLQMNSENKQPIVKQKAAHKPYLEATGAVPTDGLVKPLPPQGHLVDDNLSNSVKYFFKDIAYDVKSVKEGIQGTANDHKLGRLNDVGLRLGGIGIAAYLASRTKNPKLRLMEYVGLGTFLASMSIYPKLVINTPARIMHGYDIDKEYIDDQGRKKSVMQDSNYVPYDMYQDATKEEDLELIGDKMGIPRDIKNRNDITREQMRKIATQNNTLWMLTAGVTPAMTALMCCGLDKFVIAPGVEKARNAKFNNMIQKLLESTYNMDLNLTNIEDNKLNEAVNKVLESYKGKELPKEQFEQLVKTLTKNMDENSSEAIKSDVRRILETAASGSGTESVIFDKKSIENIVKSAEKAIGRKNPEIEKIFIPSAEEIENAIRRICPNADFEKGLTIGTDKLAAIEQEIKNIFDAKVINSSIDNKEFLTVIRNNVLENVSKSIRAKQSLYLSDEAYNQISGLSKILGEFKHNQELLDKCKSFKFEYTQETVLARSYEKFEKAFINSLGLTTKELKLMKESSDYAEKLLDKKITEICKDEEKYKKTIEQFGKIISDMEIKLNGEDIKESQIKDLITAIENNYNNTARRLAKLNMGSFENIINRLVKDNTDSLGNSIKSKEQLFDFLDGIIEDKFKNVDFYNMTPEQKSEFILYNQKGLGSSKHQEISRILERYQGAKNSFYRTIHMFEVYKRALTPDKFAESLNGKDANYVKEVINFIKRTVMSASSSDHNLKLNTVNNPLFYKDVMHSGWIPETNDYGNIKQKGYVTDSAKEALGKERNLANGNVLERFQWYLTRFRNIISNSDVDFTKPNHMLDSNIRNAYTKNERTRMAFFNLIGQSPLDMAKGAAKRKYIDQKWLKIMGSITAGIFGVAILAQFGFGKIKNPHNMQKQVTNEQIK